MPLYERGSCNESKPGTCSSIRNRPNREFLHRTEPNRISKNNLPNRTEPNFYRTEFLLRNFQRQSRPPLNKKFQILFSLKFNGEHRSRCCESFCEILWKNFYNFSKLISTYHSCFEAQLLKPLYAGIIRQSITYRAISNQLISDKIAE